MKKVGKYIIITLLMLLGLCCVGVLYLFFIPGSTLFKVTYVNLNEKHKIDGYNISEVNQVNLNSRAYDVNILPTEEDNVYVEVLSNNFGFVLVENKTTTISSSIKNDILTIDVHETYGFATKNNSYVNLYIPAGASINLNLTNTKAKTTIKSNAFEINNLNYKTTNGDFEFQAGKINGSLDLNLGKSNFTIYKDVETNNNNIKLSMSTGKFYAEESILGDIEITNNERGVISTKECSDLVSTKSTSAGGQIYVKKLSQATINSSDTIIEIGEVNEGLTIDLTGAGSVKINKLSVLTYSSITTMSGNIIIDNCESTVILHTDSGNISVNNAKKTVSVKTNYGNANISFSKDASHYSESDETKSRTLYATIYNGHLTATGVEHIGVATEENEINFKGITVTGNGRVDIIMDNIYGENAIVGKNGSINVVINASSQYLLTTASSTGNVRVNLSQIDSYRGYTTKESKTTAINCSNSANTLSVTTNEGDLTLLDTIMKERGF